MPFLPSEFCVYLVYHNRQTYESRPDKIEEVREQSKPPKGNPVYLRQDATGAAFIISEGKDRRGLGEARQGQTGSAL